MQLAASNEDESNLFSEPTRSALTEAFFSLTDHWQLKRQEQAQLLGWDYQDKRSKLDAMRLGKTILEKDQDKLQRVVQLVNIHRSLRILFPHDRELVYQWIKVKRERFGGYCALDIMLTHGLAGISAIRHYLDYERTR